MNEVIGHHLSLTQEGTTDPLFLLRGFDLPVVLDLGVLHCSLSWKLPEERPLGMSRMDFCFLF